jgi:hypothetical protein
MTSIAAPKAFGFHQGQMRNFHFNMLPDVLYNAYIRCTKENYLAICSYHNAILSLKFIL